VRGNGRLGADPVDVWVSERCCVRTGGHARSQQASGQGPAGKRTTAFSNTSALDVVGSLARPALVAVLAWSLNAPARSG
jgi:hypothetical protein